MTRNHNDLSRIPLSPYAWHTEAFRAARDAHPRAVTRAPIDDVLKHERGWLVLGQKLGERYKALAGLAATLRRLPLFPTRQRLSQ